MDEVLQSKAIAADENARRAALNPTGSFIVQAPAGSGKTTLLTLRFLSLLATVHNPESILAVTFTNKAANEMKSRVMAALTTTHEKHQAWFATLSEQLEAGAALPKLPATESDTEQLSLKALVHAYQRHWRLDALPARLKMVTIDSFCGRLVKQMPLLSESSAYQDIAMPAEPLYHMAVERLLGSDPDDALKQPLTDLMVSQDNDLERLTNLLIQLLAIRDQWLPWLLQLKKASSVLRPYIQDRVSRLIVDLGKELTTALGESLLSQWFECAKAASEQLDATHPLAGLKDFAVCPAINEQSLTVWQAMSAWLLTSQGKLRKSMTAREGVLSPSAAKGEEKQHRSAFKKQVTELLSQLRSLNVERLLNELTLLPSDGLSDTESTQLSQLFVVLPYLVAHLKLVFAETASTDFLEVTLNAYSSLGSDELPTDLALALDYQIDHLLIDEYQDTSVIQFQLFERLIAPWPADGGKTLFLVGDPMQSIYRFRGAEVSIFLRTMTEGIGDIRPELLKLSRNFRTETALLEHLNVLGTPLLGSHTSQRLSQVPFSPFTPVKASISQHPLTLVAINDDADRAVATVTALATLNQQNTGKSIAVLAQTRTTLAPIAHLANRLAIDFNADSLFRLGQIGCVLDAWWLLLLLFNPWHTYALLVVLRSPLVNLSLQDMTLVANALPSEDMTPSGSAPSNAFALNAVERLQVTLSSKMLSPEGRLKLTALSHRLAPLLQFFNRSRLVQRWRQLWEAFSPKDCYTGYDESAIERFYQALLSAAPQLASLSALIEFRDTIAEEWLAKHSSNSLTKTGIDSSQGESPATNANEIALMTIHHSKGLEFDEVIVADLDKSTLGDPNPLLVWYEHATPDGVDFFVSPLSAKGDDSSELYDYLRYLKQSQNYYERKRLAYVAMTRAKASLTFIVEVGDDSHTIKRTHSLLGEIWEPLCLQATIRLHDDAEFQQLQPLQPKLHPGSQTSQTPAWHPISSWQTPQTLPSTSAPEITMPMDSLALASDEIAETLNRPLWQVKNRSQQLGILAHRYIALSLIAPLTSAPIEKFSQLIHRWLQADDVTQLFGAKGYEAPELVEFVESIDDAMQLPLMNYLATIKGLKGIEQTLSYRGKLLQPDFWCLEGDHLTIIDFKCCHDTTKANLIGYGAQLNRYEQALISRLPTPIHSVTTHLILPDKRTIGHFSSELKCPKDTLEGWSQLALA